MGEQFDKAASLQEICRAARETRRGAPNKDASVEWGLHTLSKGKKLRDDVLSGRYKMRRGVKVQIYRPKRREAIAPYCRDKVWQRSMCNNGVYHDLTRSNIFDNMACQKGKGTDLAIKRVLKKMKRLHRKANGGEIYGVHLDVKKYFPSTPHWAVKELDSRKITEEKFLPYLYEIIDSVPGDIGTGLGSQINQINQVCLMDRIDHEIICLGVEYIRYNDDFLIMSTDKDLVRKAKEIAFEEIRKLGLTPVDKAGIFSLYQGFQFMRKRFTLKHSGKIIIRLHKKALSDEKKVLKRLKKRWKEGEIPYETIKAHYQSWAANASYAGRSLIRTMDRFYSEIFGRRPEYKVKRRYLYGRHQEKTGGHDQGAGSGEQRSSGEA